MKFVDVLACLCAAGRAPQGARGLKFPRMLLLLLMTPVAPRKGRVG